MAVSRKVPVWLQDAVMAGGKFAGFPIYCPWSRQIDPARVAIIRREISRGAIQMVGAASGVRLLFFGDQPVNFRMSSPLDG
jgi:hypothetical protein